MATTGPPLDRLAALAGRSWRVAELTGGLTNHNLRVTATDDGPALDVVVRCFGSDEALLGIDRDAEHANSLRAAATGVGAPVLEYRPDLSMLVIGFLPGRTLDDADLCDPDVLARAARACRRLHAGPAFVNEFDMVRRQATYRETVRDRGFAVPASYDDHACAWAEVAQVLASLRAPTRPCNNDLLAANFIDDAEQVRLIDYEYSGNNDPFFDLGNTATECGFSEDMLDAYLAVYLDRAPRPSELARVRLHSLASEYGWSLWGFIQASTNPLDFDFRGWGLERLEKAAATFGGPRLRSLVEDAARE